MEHWKTKIGVIIPKRVTSSYTNFSNEIQNSEFFLIMIGLGREFVIEKKEEMKSKLIEIYSDPGNLIAEKLIKSLGEEENHHIYDLLTYTNIFMDKCHLPGP